MAKRKKNPHAAALGKLGGIAAAAAMTRQERQERGRKAANTRWAAHKQISPQAE